MVARPNLTPLFQPTSIAVVGASPDRTKIGGRVLRLLVEYRFPGKLYGVNPRYDQIDEIPCLSSPEALPDAVDLAVVAVPAPAAVQAVRACARRGVKAVIVMSAGFGEAGEEGRRREAELLAIVRQHGMALVGPNTDGIMNVGRGLAAVFATAMETPGLEPGGLSLVTQTGGFGSYAISLARQTGVGLAYWVSVGNAALLHVHDYARFLASHEETRVLGIYLEAIRDGAALLEVTDAYLASAKPIVLLKGGMSTAGQRAAATHTGSLAGSARAWEGAVRAHGMVLTSSFEEFFDTAAAFAALGRPVGPRFAIVASSGAGGVVALDVAQRAGLALASYTPEVAAELRTLLPFEGRENPLDLGTPTGTPGFVEQVLGLVGSDPNVDGMLFLTGAREKQGPRLLAEVSRASRASGKPVFVGWTACLPETLKSFWQTAIPCYRGAAVTIEVAARVARYWRERPRLLDAIARRKSPGAGPPPGFPIGAPGVGMLGDRSSKALLARYGIPAPPGRLAYSADEAAEIAEALGYPVVLKVESADLPHKTEAGGVRLGLSSRTEVASAFAGILQSMRARAPAADIAGIYVERMAGGGIELLLGISRDPQFRLCLTVGLGGIWAEALQDVAVRPLPVSDLDVADMLDSLKGRALLAGARGSAVCRASVESAAMAVARLAQDLGDRLEGLDINPLLAGPEGAVALDARIQLRKGAGG